MGVVLTRSVNCFLFVLQSCPLDSLPLTLCDIWLTWHGILKNERRHIIKREHIAYLEQVARYAMSPNKGDIIVYDSGVGLYSGMGVFLTISKNGTITQDIFDRRTMKVMRWARRT